MNFRYEYSGEAGNLSAALIEIGTNERVESATGLRDGKAVERWARTVAASHKAAQAVAASKSEIVSVSGNATFAL